MEITEQLTPFLNFGRQQWAELRKSVPLKLTDQDLKPLLGFNEELSLNEVSTIYLPLARLINYYIDENLRRQTVLNRFLGGQSPKVPLTSLVSRVVWLLGKLHRHVFCNRCYPTGLPNEKLI